MLISYHFDLAIHLSRTCWTGDNRATDIYGTEIPLLMGSFTMCIIPRKYQYVNNLELPRY